DRGRGQLSLAAGNAKLTPRTRAESLAAAAIPSIPAAVIEPFLIRPLVVEPDGINNAPTIVAAPSDRVIVGTGDIAYVRGLSDAKESTWYLYRRGKALVDPDTNQTLGYEAIYLGTAQNIRAGDPATVKITSAVQEIGPGDKLVAAGTPQPVNYAPHSPTAQIKGRVMAVYGGLGTLAEAGPQSIIVINRGKADGLEIGHVVAVNSRGATVRDRSRSRATVQLPEERSGLAFVFRVFDHVSYALVMQISKSIVPQDVVQNP
ncbi:MAG TPA: hypothetical protein VEC75_05790, partial [Stellaceae bacterium]|nr:hypothetical protein [Stellaceae bacterium]